MKVNHVSLVEHASADQYISWKKVKHGKDINSYFVGSEEYHGCNGMTYAWHVSVAQRQVCKQSDT